MNTRQVLASDSIKRVFIFSAKRNQKDKLRQTIVSQKVLGTSDCDVDDK